MDKVSIALLDPHVLIRKAITALLADYPQYTITTEANTLDDLLEKLKSGPLPQIVLMDVLLPGKNGYDSAAWLHRHFPYIKVVALSSVNTNFAISRMADEGISGFVSKNAPIENLLYVLEKVMEPDFEAGGIGGLLVQRLLPPSFKSKRQYISVSLTSTETRFMQLCCSHKTYEQIAAELNTSVGMIDKMRARLFEKLEVQSRTDLCLFIVSNGIHCWELAA